MDFSHRFEKGGRVYHRNLEKYGTFEEYDQIDRTACFVTFDTEDKNFEDTRCVSLNWLEKVE